MSWLKRIFTGSSGGAKMTATPRSFVYSNEIPIGLGVRAELASDAGPLIGRLANVLSENYTGQVHSRVLSRHPEIGEAKYRWMEFEMKRFFLLTALLSNVPMYSDEADLVWHEMLMFTREYQQFCDEFAGFYIHHQPNVNADTASVSESEWRDRDIFELVYAALFDLTPENQRLLGLFYRRKMHPDLMQELQTMDSDRVRAVLGFRDTSDPVVGTVQDAVIANILDKMSQARSFHEENDAGNRSAYYGGFDPLWTMMAFGMATDMSPFEPHREDLAAGDLGEGQGDTGSGSSCSTSDGGGSSSSSSDGGSGSSCSSSSCGSSCGGN